MQKKRYYDLNTYFKNRYGHRVHKISLDAGFTCPNRDGKIATDGCIYCNTTGSGTNALSKGLSIKKQIENGKIAIIKRYKAKKFIAYFQSFTNTYAPLEKLKDLYESVLEIEDIIGLSIGTRPDCISTPLLDLLQAYAKNYLIWLEYGMQTIHNKTLAQIKRGHNFECFERAVDATKNRGISICTHVILGLPNERPEDMLETAKKIAKMSIDGIKLHLLYVIKGTQLETLYRSGAYTCLTQKTYVDLLGEFIELLPDNIVIQRLTADPHPKELVAPAWSMDKKSTIELVKKTFEEKDIWQGKKFYGV